MADDRRRIGRLERFARVLTTAAVGAVVLVPLGGCPPVEWDFTPLDAGADVTTFDVADASVEREASRGNDAFGAPDQQLPTIHCLDSDPGCNPCFKDFSCPNNEQCSPDLHYCVDCVDNSGCGNGSGEFCELNQCVHFCSSQSDCQRGGFGFCDLQAGRCTCDTMSDCQNPNRPFCRTQTGVCVECTTAHECQITGNGDQCSVGFFCYWDDAGAPDEAGSHDR